VEVTVYWRPGCGYCTSLRRDLDRRGITAVWVNIWEDDEARAFVRSVARGNETVPTVVVGDVAMVNPRGGDVMGVLATSPEPADP
jgi:glutaredoxin-like protein